MTVVRLLQSKQKYKGQHWYQRNLQLHLFFSLWYFLSSLKTCLWEDTGNRQRHRKHLPWPLWRRQELFPRSRRCRQPRLSTPCQSCPPPTPALILWEDIWREEGNRKGWWWGWLNIMMMTVCRRSRALGNSHSDPSMSVGSAWSTIPHHYISISVSASIPIRIVYLRIS